MKNIYCNIFHGQLYMSIVPAAFGTRRERGNVSCFCVNVYISYNILLFIYLFFIPCPFPIAFSCCPLSPFSYPPSSSLFPPPIHLSLHISSFFQPLIVIFLPHVCHSIISKQEWELVTLYTENATFPQKYNLREDYSKWEFFVLVAISLAINLFVHLIYYCH